MKLYIYMHFRTNLKQLYINSRVRNFRYASQGSRLKAKVISFQPIPPFIFPLLSLLTSYTSALWDGEKVVFKALRHYKVNQVLNIKLSNCQTVTRKGVGCKIEKCYMLELIKTIVKIWLDESVNTVETFCISN